VFIRILIVRAMRKSVVRSLICSMENTGKFPNLNQIPCSIN
jgi:hypothetical protein